MDQVAVPEGEGTVNVSCSSHLSDHMLPWWGSDSVHVSDVCNHTMIDLPDSIR